MTSIGLRCIFSASSRTVIVAGMTTSVTGAAVGAAAARTGVNGLAPAPAGASTGRGRPLCCCWGRRGCWVWGCCGACPWLSPAGRAGPATGRRVSLLLLAGGRCAGVLGRWLGPLPVSRSRPPLLRLRPPPPAGKRPGCTGTVSLASGSNTRWPKTSPPSGFSLRSGARPGDAGRFACGRVLRRGSPDWGASGRLPGLARLAGMVGVLGRAP